MKIFRFFHHKVTGTVWRIMQRSSKSCK